MDIIHHYWLAGVCSIDEVLSIRALCEVLVRFYVVEKEKWRVAILWP